MRQSVQELMERYQNNLFAAAFNVCKSKEDAEDVVQDTKYLATVWFCEPAACSTCTGCTGFQYCRWSANFPGRRSAVYRGYSSDGSRCAGCIQLSEETVYCKEAGSISYLFCFLHSRGEIP